MFFRREIQSVLDVGGFFVMLVREQVWLPESLSAVFATGFLFQEMAGREREIAVIHAQLDSTREHSHSNFGIFDIHFESESDRRYNEHWCSYYSKKT